MTHVEREQPVAIQNIMDVLGLREPEAGIHASTLMPGQGISDLAIKPIGLPTIRPDESGWRIEQPHFPK